MRVEPYNKYSMQRRLGTVPGLVVDREKAVEDLTERCHVVEAVKDDDTR